jgi:tetratricopeptide (TPR) repeat protein
MGKLFNFLVYALILTVPSLASCTNNEKIDEQALYEEAQKAIDSYPGNQDGLVKAEKLLKKIYKANHKSALAQTGLGRLAYCNGYINYENYTRESLTEAHSHFAKALSIDPQLLDAYYYGANPYLYEKNYAQAKALAQKAQTIDPKSPKVDILFAKIAKKENNTDEVEIRAKHVIETASDKRLVDDAYSLLTWVYKDKKQYDLAEEAYKKIIELDAASPWAKINYSSFLITLRKYDEAIDYGKQALAIMDFEMGHHVLGKAFCGKGIALYWEEKRPDEAKGFFEAAVQHDPENADAYYGLGMSLYSTGHRDKNVAEIEKAEIALKKAIQLNPEHQQAKVALNRLEMLLSAVRK